MSRVLSSGGSTLPTRNRTAVNRGCSSTERSPRVQGCGHPYPKRRGCRLPARAPIGEHRVMKKELAYRENDGITVTLLWHTATDRLSVSVLDWRTGEAFDIAADA